jgi:hypothetical protein
MIASVRSIRSSSEANAVISLVLPSTTLCPRTTPVAWSNEASRCTARASARSSLPRARPPRAFLPSIAISLRGWSDPAGRPAQRRGCRASPRRPGQGPRRPRPAAADGSRTHSVPPAPRSQAHPRRRGQIVRPFRDRGVGTRSSQYRAHRYRQHRGQPMASAATSTRIRQPRQYRQQIRCLGVVDPRWSRGGMSSQMSSQHSTRRR